MLTEQGSIAPEDLPVAEFRAHLRLGTGFADDSLQDNVLAGFLRAAMAAVEARTGKALIEREFLWSVSRDPTSEGLCLPVAPVSALVRISTVDAAGGQMDLALADFSLRPDAYAPMLMGTLPALPRGGLIEVVFLAGYGPEWSDVPGDLAQAVMMLAAHYYEFRNDTGLGPGCMPFGVSSLIERHRKLRIGMGAGQ